MSRPSFAFLVALALCAVGQAGCFEVRYLAREGVDLLKLMRARRDVSEVIADPETPHFVKQRLRLAMQARQFGIEVLGLHGGADFTRYVDTHGHLGYNLTVAESTRLRLVTWGGGRVPYLGFLTRETALATKAHFERAGYDTALRDIDAFSGMGVILSPIYSDTISTPGPVGELRTVENVLHEMAHCTVPFFTATELNEPFATVVGHHGAAMFFRLRERDSLLPSPQAPLARVARGQASREGALSTWLRGALIKLAAFYRQAAAAHLPTAEILRRREEVFRLLQEDYRRTFPGPRYKILAEGPLNNAELLSLGVYLAPGAERLGEDKKEAAAGAAVRRGGNLQQDLLAAMGGDVRAYISLYKKAAEGNEPIVYLRRIASDYRHEMGLDKPAGAGPGSLGPRSVTSPARQPSN
jgi:predicted aminopeptidase